MGSPLGIVQHHVGGQVPVLAAQAVDHPGAQRRPPGKHAPRMHDKQRGFVGDVGREHGPDHRDIVYLLRQVRHHLRHLGTRFTPLGELERGRHQTAGFPHCSNFTGQVSAGRLTGKFLQGGFGIQQIHLARSAVHEQLNDRGGPGLVMGLLLFQIVDLPRTRRQEGTGRQKVLPQQGGQGGSLKAVSHLGKEGPPVDGCGTTPGGSMPLSGIHRTRSSISAKLFNSHTEIRRS